MDVQRQRRWNSCVCGCFAALATTLPAQPAVPPPVSAGTNASSGPRQLGPGLYEVGKVTINQTERTVSFPVVVNQRTGLVEYAVVAVTGKTHESVFRTEAAPQDVQVGLLLLGAKPAGTNFTAPDGSWSIPGEKVSVAVNWREPDREVRRPIEEFIVTTNNARTLTPGPWVFNGSFVDYGTFIAQRDGSLVSIQEDASALINNPRSDRTNDDWHFVNSAVLPPGDTPLELMISLYQPVVASPPLTNLLDGVVTPITPAVYSTNQLQPK